MSRREEESKSRKSKSRYRRRRGTDGREIRRVHFIPRYPLAALALPVLAVRRDDDQEVEERPEGLAIRRG